MAKKEIKAGSMVEYIEPFEEQVGFKYKVIENPNISGFVILETINQPITSHFAANVLDLKHSK